MFLKMSYSPWSNSFALVVMVSSWAVEMMFLFQGSPLFELACLWKRFYAEKMAIFYLTDTILEKTYCFKKELLPIKLTKNR